MLFDSLILFLSFLSGISCCLRRSITANANSVVGAAFGDEYPFMRPPDYDWFQAHTKADPIIAPHYSLSGPVRASLQGILKICTSYSTTNTSSATQNTVSCTFTVKSGTKIMISDCSSSGCLAQPQTDQVIRLYNAAGTEVMTGDDDAICGKCAKIVYQVPSSINVVQTFTLQQGCYGHSPCTGTFTVSRVDTMSCPGYVKSSTTFATTNTSSCFFTVCPGSSISISDSTCQGSGNDQFIRLYDTFNNMITSNDDASSATRCSAIESNFVGGNCQIFDLRQGCSDEGKCSGSFTVSGVATGASTFSFAPSIVSSSSPSTKPSSKIPTLSPSSVIASKRPTVLPTPKSSSARPSTNTAKTSKQSIGVLTCNSFSASNTNDATTNTATCTFTAPAGVSLLISDCSSEGCVAIKQVDQFIRLYDSNGNQVAFNDDDADKVCGLCSKIVYKTPDTPMAMQYTLEQGCKGNSVCTGSFAISVLSKLSCSPYKRSNTLSASQNTSTCSFNACPGSLVSISGCGSSGCDTKSNDQYIKVLDQSGSVVAINDDGSCNFCSATTLKLSGTSCQSYTLLQGCYGMKACVGQFEIDGVSNPIVLYTSLPSTKPSSASPSTLIPSTASPSLSKTNAPVLIHSTPAPTTNNIIIQCTSYSVSLTNSASTGTADCTFVAPGGVTLLIADCASSGCIAGTSDQYIKLFDSDGLQVSQNDDFCGTCSAITYTTPNAASTYSYTLKQGCYYGTSCTGTFTVSIVQTYVCPSFTASNTNTATQNTPMCSFSACPGTTLSISSCSSPGCSIANANDQYIKLYDASGTSVLIEDDDSCAAGAFTGACSSISSYKVVGGTCRNFILSQGCWAQTSCSGQFYISGTLSGSSPLPSSSPYLGSSIFPVFTNLPTISPPPNAVGSSTQPWSSFPTISPPPNVAGSSIQPAFTKRPTVKPSSIPTFKPSTRAPLKPSNKPTTRPSVPPSRNPTKIPSKTVSPSAKSASVSPSFKPITATPLSVTNPVTSPTAPPVSLTPVAGYPEIAGVTFNYNGGLVMTGNVNIYNIYYGDFSSQTSQQMISLVDFFAANIGGSSWYNMVTTFYQTVNSVTTYVSNSVTLAKSIQIKKTTIGGPLTENEVISYISEQITSGVLPIDTKGIYAFIFRGDVNFNGWVGSSSSQWCGYHGMFTYTNPTTQVSHSLKFWLQGDPGTAPGITGTYCSGFQTSSYPNNNFGADTLVSVYAHELVEVVTDFDYAWYDTGFGQTRGYENADICGWTYGTLLPGQNNANTVIGGKNWLIQQNWIPGVGCRQQL